MMGGLKLQQGFTTVELLVTLFVAAMMVVSGYQLYNAVTLRNGRIGDMSEASNVAYNLLRENDDALHPTTKNTITTSCGTSHTSGLVASGTLPNDGSPSATTLPGAPRYVLYKCRAMASGNAIRVTAQVYYDIPEKGVVHATYVSP